LEAKKDVEPLKKALAEIPGLRALHYRDGQLANWATRVSRLLESSYGKDSTQYRQFVNAPGAPFKMGTEFGMEQSYQQRIDCYEEVLKTLVG